MNKKLFKIALVLLLTLTVIVICSSCGNTQAEDADSLKFMMNGSYYLHFKGVDYPIKFENGSITWLETPPDELFFVQMFEIFKDKDLKKRCCHLGLYIEVRPFHTDEYHRGYLSDGKRPKDGSVLYIDETKLKRFSMGNSGSSSKFMFAPDDTLCYKNSSGFPREVACWNGKNLFYSESDGVFFENLNTIRKAFEYARANGIPFDGKLRYTGLSYPTSIMSAFDEYNWEEDYYNDGTFIVSPASLNGNYNVTLDFGDENYPNKHFIIFNPNHHNGEWQIENFKYRISCGYYADLVYDEEGNVIKCRDLSKNTVNQVFYTVEAFNEYLKSEKHIDYGARKAISHFTSSFDIINMTENLNFNAVGSNTDFVLHAVWDEIKVVRLNSAEASTEVYVFKNAPTKLPDSRLAGYEFVGWYTDESFTSAPITEVNYSDTITDLYAKFNKVDFYTLTFESYEGQTFDEIKYAYGDNVHLPVLSKPFYLFMGWSTTPDGSEMIIKNVDESFFGSYHLYPYFEPLKYTFTLVTDGTAERVSVAYGEAYTLPIKETEKTFIGYFDIDGIQYTDEQGNSLVPFTDGADITLYARFKEE
jgi:uncharacterized repeat protein (TIGR02543 family)